MHACIHTHTHAQPHTHARTHATHTHTHTCTHMHTRMQVKDAAAKGLTDVVIAWEHSCISRLVSDLNGVDGVASSVNWNSCSPSNCSPSCSAWSGDSDGKENKVGCFDVYFQFEYDSRQAPTKGAQGFVGSSATANRSTTIPWYQADHSNLNQL